MACLQGARSPSLQSTSRAWVQPRGNFVLAQRRSAPVGLLFTMPVGLAALLVDFGCVLRRQCPCFTHLLSAYGAAAAPAAARREIWAIIIVTLVMAIPGTVLAVGFNALYAAAVPPASR